MSRFKAKEEFDRLMVLNTDKCVEWPGAKLSGYGYISWEGKLVRTHRLAMQLTHGEIPAGKPLVLHKPNVCHNRACMNVRHLKFGTHQDNNDDMLVDGVHRGAPFGNTNRMVPRKSPAKQRIPGQRNHLNESQARMILEDERSNVELADEFGVSRWTVRAVRVGRTWRHLHA